MRLSQLAEGPFKGAGKMMMKRKLNKQYKKSDLANFDDSGMDTDGKSPEEIGDMKSDYYHSNMDKADRAKKAKARLSREDIEEAGGYYTQPVYDMIEKHGYEKVMHELLTSLDADVIQSFLQRTEINEAGDTKYGIVRYPDTAISYIKNDGNGWEHIYDRSYGFKGPVDKADLKHAKKIAKEKIPSRMIMPHNTSATQGERMGGSGTMYEGTEAITEEQFDEAAGTKDACYRKVKSRYKVWPSAYASGALVKCRKVGAANWGNSKK